MIGRIKTQTSEASQFLVDWMEHRTGHPRCAQELLRTLSLLMISLRSDSVKPSLFSSRMAGRSGFPIMSPFDPCLPCCSIGAFHESQMALSSLYFMVDFPEFGNSFCMALSP